MKTKVGLRKSYDEQTSYIPYKYINNISTVYIFKGINRRADENIKNIPRGISDEEENYI